MESRLTSKAEHEILVIVLALTLGQVEHVVRWSVAPQILQTAVALERYGLDEGGLTTLSPPHGLPVRLP